MSLCAVSLVSIYRLWRWTASLGRCLVPHPCDTIQFPLLLLAVVVGQLRPHAFEQADEAFMPDFVA